VEGNTTIRNARKYLLIMRGFGLFAANIVLFARQGEPARLGRASVHSTATALKAGKE
jgi:hypothetical protein